MILTETFCQKSTALSGYYNPGRLHIQYKYHFTKRRVACRLAKGMTQEQLANEVGVVVTHISHIETGNSVPSLKTLIDIINALDCSADELLCIEIKKAKPVFDSWMTEQLADCSSDEAKIIKETVVSLKKSLRKVYGKSSKYRYD